MGMECGRMRVLAFRSTAKKGMISTPDTGGEILIPVENMGCRALH